MKELLAITKGLRVLYVEDDEAVRESSLELFGNFFDDITTAADGLEGFDKYKSEMFDLVITDISMPRMDGIELVREIRMKDRMMPIIVYSAWNDPSYMTACISLNVDGYLLKPIQTSNVIEVLQKVSSAIASQKKRSDSEEKAFEDTLKSKFDIDKLTQLKSHNALLEKLDNISAVQTPVMILLNIDEFHVYNEIYGLGIGNQILQAFASNIQTFCQGLSYELFRMSGDEFILFEVANALDPERYHQDIEALLHFIETTSIVIEGVKEPIVLSVTIGISFDRENSYGRATMALNEARRRGRHYLGFSVDVDIRHQLQNNLYWREEINSAIQEGRVHAFYHPIVDANKKVVKYESLVRILQPQKDGTVKVISPREFLDFSKMSRQYLGLTKVVISESFKTMIDHNVHVAINLTYQDIENSEIAKLLREQLKKHQLASKMKFDISSQVIFELLDHPNSEGYDNFVKFINEFKALGVLITIDNFGLGFSNMSKISALAPHYVKIDATLMKNIDTDEHSYQLVKAIVTFAKELGIKTIAEHVTNEVIFEKSKELGIDEFQGYYFGEPLAKILSE
jgi:diguanylate cyclase (GGDEF)-like protein